MAAETATAANKLVVIIRNIVPPSFPGMSLNPVTTHATRMKPDAAGRASSDARGTVKDESKMMDERR
jgi:hypothetical protein